MATYQLIRCECTSAKCSRMEEIEKQIITTHTNTTEGVYTEESFHCMLGIVYSISLKSWECSYVYFKMETYILIRSECTSAQCCSREEIEKQIITTHTNTTEGVYTVESFHYILGIEYSISLKSWECSSVYFKIETYDELIRSECTSAQCSGREEIEKQVNTVTHKHY